MSDELPIACHHKGVAIFAGQSARRIALVRKEIDRVSKIGDLEHLYEIAGDCAWSPEARLFAGARCIAGLEVATEQRKPKPPHIAREDVEARTAGLGSIRWADPDKYCSLLDAHHERAAEREEPLPDLE